MLDPDHSVSPAIHSAQVEGALALPPSSIASGNGSITSFLPDPQTAVPPIPFIDLPNEVLLLIVGDDWRIANLLSMTCPTLHRIFQDLLPAHKYQYQRIIDHMSRSAPTPRAVRADKSYMQKDLLQINASVPTGRLIPLPATPEWEQLKNGQLGTTLTRYEYKRALLQRDCIITWNLLLHPEILKNRQQAADLMKTLLHFLPHIPNAQAYITALFDHGLSWNIIDQLAHLHLDRCTQLVARHFSPSHVSHFISAQFSCFKHINIESYIKGLRAGCIQSMLTATVHELCRLYEGRKSTYRHLYEENSNLLQMLFEQGCDLEQTKCGRTVLVRTIMDHRPAPSALVKQLLQHADPNATNKDGMTPLMLACNSHQKKLIRLLLENERTNVNVKLHPKSPEDDSVLYYAMYFKDILLIQSVLAHPTMQLDTVASSFYQAISCGKDNSASLLLQAIDAQKKDEVLTRALALAINRKQHTIAEIMIRQWGAIPPNPDQPLPISYGDIGVALVNFELSVAASFVRQKLTK
jgi:ankyrin repeat protein